MADPNTNADEPRLVLTGGGSSARVVLAEVDAPGSLHYLLEAEGFQVVGCAGDEEELGRVLGQGVRPDVIVLDADIVVTTSLVARELAPDAHVIAIWPDDVQPPPGGERVSPRLVYEELGPAIRRHMDRRSVPVPVIALPADEPAMASVAAGAGLASGAALATGGVSSGVVARTASRMSVLSVTLITAILLTMGVSFALGGFHLSPDAGPPRVLVPGSSDTGGVAGTSDPLTSRVPSAGGSGPSGTKAPKNGPNRPSDHHNALGAFDGVVVTTGTGDGGGSSGSQTGDQGTGQGDQGGTGQGDQGGGSGDQGGGSGNQGGGQGDQGGGSGDQGGGSGNQGGGQGDQGGGQGGGQGDQGGGGQGDQGGSGQGDQGGSGQGDQGSGDQGDQGGDGQGQDQQGDENSQGAQGPHGDGHGAHSDIQGQNDQGQNDQVN